MTNDMNDSAFLRLPDAPPPVIGRVRARITRPLVGVEPTVRGRFGRAWRADLEAARRSPSGDPRQPDAMLDHWIIEAPWSHQIVHSCSLVLVHLRFMLDKRPVEKLIPGASHEVHLHAIHPEVDRAVMLREPIDPSRWLTPPVFAAQLAESTDAGARARALRAVELVCEGRLSTHPAHVRAWGELLGDNMLRQYLRAQ